MIDASGQVLGRLAVRIANLLNGKYRTDYSPHLDMGDVVVVKNAAQIKVTGKKSEQKIYRHHTTFPGGLKERPFKTVFQKDPREVIRLAVSRMLPKNKLRDKKLKRLKIEA